MTTQHTPGPWDPLRNGIEVQSHEGMHEIHACVGGVPVPVAQVWPTMDIEHDDPIGEYQISETEGLANLALIAAAPDLLAALQRLADVAHKPTGWTEDEHATTLVHALLQANDALAKAKGQS